MMSLDVYLKKQYDIKNVCELHRRIKYMGTGGGDSGFSDIGEKRKTLDNLPKRPIH